FVGWSVHGAYCTSRPVVAPYWSSSMALYKHGNFLGHIQDPIFDQVNTPGYVTPRSGIYRCLGCGREAVSEEAKPLPPQNHHQHTIAQGHIRWQMIVYADHK